MKQRLLLALLMLLTSAGFLKAQSSTIDISVPKGEGTTTVTISSDEFPFNEGDYPTYSANEAVTHTFGTKSVVYTIKQDKDARVEFKINTDVHAWGNLFIKLNGKISSFVANRETSLSKLVKSLEFENNGELETLQLGDNQRRFNYFPNLTTLNVSGNKLKYIPFKIDTNSEYKEIKITHYLVGKQTPAVSLAGISGNAKTGLQLTMNAFAFNSSDNVLAGATDFDIVALKDKSTEKDVTSYAVEDETTPGKYFFKNGSIFMDGEFIAEIKVNDDKYAGAIICGVPLTVTPAQFTLKVENGEHGKINSSIQSGTAVTKGQEIVFTPVPDAGYTFSDFTTKGLTKGNVDSNKYSYTVTGDEDPTITANFKAGNSSIEITQPANGTIKVLDENGKEVTNPAVGSTVEIRVNANYGYEVDKVYNGDDLLSDDDNERPEYFTHKMIVPAGGLKLSAVMVIKTSNLTIAFTGALNSATVLVNGSLKSPETDTSKGLIYSDIPYNASLSITFVLKNEDDGISIVSGSQNYTPRKTVNGKEVAYVLDDFTMPVQDTRMVVTITSMNAIDVVVAEADKKMTYDGTPKAIKYTTDPNNLEGFKVEYSADKGTSYTETPFTAAGNYKVRFTREADATHAAFTKVIDYEITLAQVVITEEPKVEVVKENGTDIYKLSGGKAAYKRGDQFIDITAQGEFSTTQQVNDNDKAVTVSFTPKDVKNLISATVNVTLAGDDVEKYTVKIDPSSTDILTMWNGNAQIKDGATVLAGTTITFDIKVDSQLGAVAYEVVQIDGEGNVVAKQLNNGVKVGEHGDINATTIVFKVLVNDGRQEIILGDESDSVEERTQEVDYDGSVKKYDWKKLLLTTKDNSSVTDGIWTITYTKDGKTVAEPTDAGTYDVTLNREATENFQAFSTTATLVINQAKLTAAQVPAPTASRINVGMKLNRSYLSGSADIAGYYQWDTDGDTEVMKSEAYPVIFYPNNGNYEPYKLETQVTVPVTDEAIIVVYSDYNGTVTVKDAEGNYYNYGDAVPEGTKLIITAIPSDNTKFEVESLTVDGNSFTSGGTYVFGKKSIEISATFQVKTKPGNFKVTVPEYLRGTIITGGGEHVVAEGGTLSFTVATASADASKVSVKASNGTVTKGSNGRYTLSGLTANSTVTVSLSNPTALKVDIQKSYLNAGKYHVATVEVESDYTDGKFYYGDEITVVAYPESGVKFEKWSDGSKDQVHDIVLTGDLKLTATFSGTPTGIEDIMAASIATGKGCVWVRGIANADVTIVSIAGRVQARQRISGDTRIDVPAGIYVVVLESGSDVKRVKVIVK